MYSLSIVPRRSGTEESCFASLLFYVVLGFTICAQIKQVDAYSISTYNDQIKKHLPSGVMNAEVFLRDIKDKIPDIFDIRNFNQEKRQKTLYTSTIVCRQGSGGSRLGEACTYIRINNEVDLNDLDSLTRWEFNTEKREFEFYRQFPRDMHLKNGWAGDRSKCGGHLGCNNGPDWSVNYCLLPDGVCEPRREAGKPSGGDPQRCLSMKEVGWHCRNRNGDEMPEVVKSLPTKYDRSYVEPIHDP